MKQNSQMGHMLFDFLLKKIRVSKKSEKKKSFKNGKSIVH